jgi:hypothetical protein
MAGFSPSDFFSCSAHQEVSKSWALPEHVKFLRVCPQGAGWQHEQALLKAMGGTAVKVQNSFSCFVGDIYLCFALGEGVV